MGDDLKGDPTNPLNPGRYPGHPGIDHGQIPQATTRDQAAAGPVGYVSMRPPPEYVDEHVEEDFTSLEDYTSMDYQTRDGGGDYAALRDNTRKPEALGFPPTTSPRRMSPRTQSESEVQRMETDAEYAVPDQNLRKGSRDDSSLGLASNRTPGGTKFPPAVPDRLDLRTNTLNTTRASGSDPSERVLSSSPYGTSPRKRPIPTPRTKKSRPCSDGFVGPNTNGVDNSSNENEHFHTRFNSESMARPDKQNAVPESIYKQVPPPIPIPYHYSTKRAPEVIGERGQFLDEIAELSLEGHPEVEDGNDNEFPVELQDQPSQADSASEQPVRNKHYIIVKSPIPNGEKMPSFTFQDSHGQEMSSKSQTPAPPVEQTPVAVNNSHPSQLIQERIYENAEAMKSSPDDLLDLSPDDGENLDDNQPIYDQPLNLPMPPEIPPEILNQPPPSPSKLFGGTMGRDVGTSNQPPIVGSWDQPPIVGSWDNAQAWAFGAEPFNAANEPVNLATQPVDPVQPASPVQPVNLVHPVNLAAQPVNPAAQPVDPVQPPDERGYGEEIDGGIREIRRICGEELARDWCYAALLQYQGDVEQVVKIVKTQKLAKITAKSEEFCERTLSHCSWDLNRAAGYILENFEDQDV